MSSSATLRKPGCYRVLLRGLGTSRNGRHHVRHSSTGTINIRPRRTEVSRKHFGLDQSLRHLSLAATSENPITISNDRQKITFRLKDGSEITQQFHPTPRAKTEKLIVALVSLLSDDTSATPPTSFGTSHWLLDPLGDAIHRHLALTSPEECDRVEKAIMDEADRIYHHPHITRVGGGDNDQGQLNDCLTVTCTTHSPRGLSVRDTRLAAKIDEVLSEFNVTRPVEESMSGQGSDQITRQITLIRETSIFENRQKILEALEYCGCEKGKS